MKLPTYRVAPLPAGGTLDYTVDWTDVLAELGDTAAAAEWVVPAGLVAGATGGSGAVRTLFVSSDTPGAYRLTCWLTTAGGRRIATVLLLDVLPAGSGATVIDEPVGEALLTEDGEPLSTEDGRTIVVSQADGEALLTEDGEPLLTEGGDIIVVG